MLYLVGLGLSGVKDITVRGLEVVRAVNKVYLEAYTSVLTVGKEALEKFYGREVIIADREFVEQDCDILLNSAVVQDVALLVVGDPMGATTHTDIVLRAVKLGIKYKIIHNTSIMNAIGCCGLQLYNFGETVSIVFWTPDWTPDSFYEKIERNRKSGLHTLCLLDIKVKEQSVENLMKGKKVYEPSRFMTTSCAADQLMTVIARKRSNGLSEEDLAFNENTICVGLARVGSDDQKIATCSLKQMVSIDLGKPLHSLIITGKLHPLEIEMLQMFVYDSAWFSRAVSQL